MYVCVCVYMCASLYLSMPMIHVSACIYTPIKIYYLPKRATFLSFFLLTELLGQSWRLELVMNSFYLFPSKELFYYIVVTHLTPKCGRCLSLSHSLNPPPPHTHTHTHINLLCSFQFLSGIFSLI